MMISILFYFIYSLIYSVNIYSAPNSTINKRKEIILLFAPPPKKANVFPQDVLTRAHTSQFVEETLLDFKIHHHLIQSLDSSPLFFTRKS